MQEPDPGTGRDSVLLPFPSYDLLQSWGLREVVVDVFWNVAESVFKYPVRLSLCGGGRRGWSRDR